MAKLARSVLRPRNHPTSGPDKNGNVAGSGSATSNIARLKPALSISIRSLPPNKSFDFRVIQGHITIDYNFRFATMVAHETIFDLDFISLTGLALSSLQKLLCKRNSNDIRHFWRRGRARRRTLGGWQHQPAHDVQEGRRRIPPLLHLGILLDNAIYLWIDEVSHSNTCERSACIQSERASGKDTGSNTREHRRLGGRSSMGVAVVNANHR